MARKVAFEFDPFEMAGIDKSSLDSRLVNEALSDIQDFVLESVLSDTAAQRSAVTGRPFAKLSPDYAKVKKGKGGKPVPNLELDGDLLSSLKVVKKSKGRLVLTVDDDQGDKADGHNNHSGDSPLPERKFIPSDDNGESFRPAIRNGIKDLVMMAVEKQIDENISDAGEDADLETLVERGVKVTLRQFED